MGTYLAALNFVLHESLGSLRWAHFWTQYRYQDCPENTMVSSLITAMAFSIQRNHFHYNTHTLDWKSVSSFLWSQKRYAELSAFLSTIYPQLHSQIDKSDCFFNLLQVKAHLNQDATNDMLSYLAFTRYPVYHLNALLLEWMKTVPDLQERYQKLKRFQQIYQKDAANINGQYIRLLQIRCLVQLGQIKRSRKALDKLLPQLNEILYSSAYELLAQIEFLSHPQNYSAAANALEEAKKYTTQKYKVLLYSKIQSECYCLVEDFHRAYCTLQETLFKGSSLPLSAELAYEWCLCGILCKASPEDLEQQLQFCHERHLITQGSEQQIRLFFAQYQFNHGHFQLALNYLHRHTFLPQFQPQIALLCAKCEYRLGNPPEALKILNNERSTPSLLSEWELWRAYIYNDLGQLEKAEHRLKVLFNLPSPDIEVQTYGKLLQAEILGKQHDWGQAKQVLLDLESSATQSWRSVVLFQAGCYAEQSGLSGKKEAISIFQKVYERFPGHDLAQDARLKQGVLLMNLNQMDLAHAIFDALLPTLKGIQALWCQFLIQKCNLMLGKCSLDVSKTQLTLLLQEELPLSFRLEIVLQLAFIYHDEGNINAFQKLLWDECYPVFDIKNQQDFSASEIYWFSRCLLTLAQYIKNKATVRQIYALMVEAELPSASLVQQYLSEGA